MATAQKTVRFAVPMLTTSMADATLTTLGAITVDLPESSKVFDSVFIKLGYMDQSTVTGATVTESRIAVAIDAVADSTATELDDLANTGENNSGILQIENFASYFTTNYTGTSHSVTIKAYIDISTGTGLTTNNITAELFITYHCDDTSTDQVETAIFPLDFNGSLQLTSTEIGTNQIPKLTGSGGMFDNLGTVTIKDWYVLLEGNSKNASTTALTVTGQIDSGASDAFGAITCSLASACWHRFLWKPSGGTPDPTTTHALKLMCNAGSMFSCIAIKLVVTYQWTPGTATRKFHSLQLPVNFDGIKGANGAQFAMQDERRIIIQEPGTITMVQSGIEFFVSMAAASTIQVKSGSQASFRAYGLGATLMCGMSQFIHRIDSGAAAGSALTLAAGVQDLVTQVYPSAGTPGGISGILYLNYTSDLSSLGVGAHSATRWQLLRVLDRTASAAFTAAYVPYTPASGKWYINGMGIVISRWENVAANANWAQTEFTSGSVPAYSLGSDALITDAELGWYESVYQGRSAYKRWPADPDTQRRSIFDANQQIRVNTLSNVQAAVLAFTTYHSQYQTDTVAVTDYTGDGSGITVKIRKVSDGSEVASLTTVAGGTASFDNYWERESLFSEVQQDATHVGRSANRTAV